jgi:hypothetical protein
MKEGTFHLFPSGKALDRLRPIVHNYLSRDFKIAAQCVHKRGKMLTKVKNDDIRDSRVSVYQIHDFGECPLRLPNQLDLHVHRNQAFKKLRLI